MMSLTQPALRCSRVRVIPVLAFAGMLLGGCAGRAGSTGRIRHGGFRATGDRSRKSLPRWRQA